jgi:hypothetical protein
VRRSDGFLGVQDRFGMRIIILQRERPDVHLAVDPGRKDGILGTCRGLDSRERRRL